MWERIGKACGWKHLRAPSIRRMFDERIAVAALNFPRDPKVSCMVLLTPPAEEEEEGVSEGEEGGPGHP